MNRATAHSIFVLIFAFPIAAFSEPTMYIPTGDANQLLVIDLKNNQITKRIDELENAHGLAAIPKQEYLIAGSMDTALSKKGAAGKPVKPAQVSEEEHKAHHSGKEPVSPSYLSIVHPEHGHVMRRIAVPDRTHHIAVDPQGKFAVATHPNLGGVSVVDLEKNKSIAHIKTGQVTNYAVFTGDGSRLYVSNAGSGTVTEINPQNWQIIKDIKVGKGPEHLELSAGNNSLYVLNVIDGSVSEIDLKKGEVQRAMPVGKSPHGLALSGDGKNLFVSNKGSASLTEIQLSSAANKTVPLSPEPYHVTYVASLNKLYVSSRKLPKIWVINPGNLNVETEINLGDKGVAHQMVVK